MLAELDCFEIGLPAAYFTGDGHGQSKEANCDTQESSETWEGRIQIGGNTYWRVSFGWVPNLQRGSPWLRRRPARVDRLIRRAQNSSIRFRKCAVTGWRARQPKSNSASNSRKN